MVKTLKEDLNFEFGLSDKQLELEASLEEFDITGYGGAKGGGKSHGGRTVPIIRGLERPGHVGALFRRSYPELEDNHLTPLFRDYPGLRGFYNSSNHTIRIPSLESEMRFRYCKTMSDVDKHAGREVHTLAIEECGDWEYDMAMRLYRNTCRSTVPGIKAAAAFLFNWGGVGHGWLKRIFFEKRLHPHEKKIRWNFILAKVEDNPMILEHDPGYLDRLESEPDEGLRRAHREGNPDIIAGQYFTELTRDIHVVKPFLIPSYWNWFGSYDYGFAHPAVWHIWAVNPEGNCFLVKEIYKSRMHIGEQAERVHEFLDAKKKSGEMKSKGLIFHAGHDCFSTKKTNEPTIADDFMNRSIVGNNLITLTRANIARITGAKQCREFLRFTHDEKTNRRHGPHFFFFEGQADHTLACFQRMVHDPSDREDVLKVDSSDGSPESGDDGYDCGRYGLMSRPIRARIPSKPKRDGYDKETNPRKDSWRTM